MKEEIDQAVADDVISGEGPVDGIGGEEKRPVHTASPALQPAERRRVCKELGYVADAPDIRVSGYMMTIIIMESVRE